MRKLFALLVMLPGTLIAQAAPAPAPAGRIAFRREAAGGQWPYCDDGTKAWITGKPGVDRRIVRLLGPWV